MATIGSLFSGFGGLDLGVQAAIGGELAWHCEIEPAACRVLEHHHPAVPNLGDITAVDWPTVAPVDVLTGGFPCQDVSSAGLRVGMKPGNRSGLWEHFARAISVLRPGLVVIENVRGLLSADAACDLEPCPWCLGDERERPLRALGAVLGDLAVLGYGYRWGCVRASDAGAPHGRARVFIVAWPATTDTSTTDARGVSGPGLHLGGTEGAQRRDGGADAGDDGGAAPSDPTGVGRRAEGWDDGLRPAGLVAGAAADPADVGHEGGGDARHRGPGSTDGGDLTATDPDRDGLAVVGQGTEPHARDDADRCGPISWGDYDPAIRRWERLLGRPAPAPTQTGRRGGQQLSPRFVEFLMGLDDGHVTDVPGLTRNQQLKLLGNGVVPQQAELALRVLLGELTQDAAA